MLPLGMRMQAHHPTTGNDQLGWGEKSLVTLGCHCDTCLWPLRNRPAAKYRWITLYPNTFNSKLTFVCSTCFHNSISIFGELICMQRNWIQEQFELLFVQIQCYPPVLLPFLAAMIPEATEAYWGCCRRRGCSQISLQLTKGDSLLNRIQTPRCWLIYLCCCKE